MNIIKFPGNDKLSSPSRAFSDNLSEENSKCSVDSIIQIIPGLRQSMQRKLLPSMWIGRQIEDERNISDINICK